MSRILALQGLRAETGTEAAVAGNSYNFSFHSGFSHQYTQTHITEEEIH
ncbi:hypothetical protein ACIQOW_24725 [Kitasatospora sp. NPDC091335]